jgi:hypothetical protein
MLTVPKTAVKQAMLCSSCEIWALTMSQFVYSAWQAWRCHGRPFFEIHRLTNSNLPVYNPVQEHFGQHSGRSHYRLVDLAASVKCRRHCSLPDQQKNGIGKQNDE